MDSIQNHSESRDGAEPLGRYMALDVGRRRTGVAISDMTGLLARTLAVIQHRGRDRRLGEVTDLVAEHGVATIVVGLPLHTSGEPSDQTRYVEAYARSLEQRLVARGLKVAICFWDERLSTIEATEIVRQNGRRARRDGDSLDDVAAAVILQEYLDRGRSERQTAPIDQQQSSATPAGEASCETL